MFLITMALSQKEITDTDARGRGLPTLLMPCQSESHRLYFTASKWSGLTHKLDTQPNNQQTSEK